MVKTKAELYDIFCDPKKSVKDLMDLGDVLRVVYETDECFIHTPGYTSLISAILVTAHARLEILRYLHMLPPKDILYCDTGMFFGAITRFNEF